MQNRHQSRKKSFDLAFCSLLVALAVCIMLAGGLIPIATYCSPMLAGVFLIPILLECGWGAAWTAYAAISLLTLMIGADKEAAFFFLALGYYPIIKWRLDRIRRRPLRVLAKLAIFNGSTAAMYAFLSFVLNMDAIRAEFAELGVVFTIIFFIVITVCMFMYDRLMMPLLFLYANKLKPRLRFMQH